MRLTLTSLRYTIPYELFLLAISIPLLSYLLNEPPINISGMVIILRVMSVGWICANNLLFDKTLIYLGKPRYPRSTWLRSIHTTLSVVGLLAITIPAVKLLMASSFRQASALGFGFLVGMFIYARIYNWGYDSLHFSRSSRYRS